VVLATNLTAEGEATASYLAEVLKGRNVRVSRIAYGLPMGADLEYADEISVGRAMKGGGNCEQIDSQRNIPTRGAGR